MFKKSFFFILSLCFGIASAWADMYAVHGIHIDVTAENATVAREQGLNDAQEKAFYKMLERLTLFKDMEALPILTSEDIFNLVQDFSVSNEKTSSVRYIADVDVQFNPEAIQTFFQEYQVPYVTSVAEKSIVFPVYKESIEADPLLWKDTNPWSRALTKVSTTSDLVPFVVPIGDLDDMAVVSEDTWNNEENLDIAPILSRYQSVNALVIELTVLKKDNAVKVFIRPFQNKKGMIGEIGLTEPINAPMPEVLKRAADRAVYLLEQAWREKNAVRFDNPTKLEVRVNIQNLGEWIAIRKRLDRIKLIKQYVVKALRRDQAEIEVFYAGNLKPFKDALRKEELFLSGNGDTWLLRNIIDVPAEELNAPETEEMPTPETEAEEPIDITYVIDEMTQENEKDKAIETKPEQDTFTTDTPVITPTEPVRTFSLELYQSIDVQPESQQMLQEMHSKTLAADPARPEVQPQSIALDSVKG